MTDYIEAIATAIETLGFNIGAGLERRAKASLVEHALKLAGFVIVPEGPTQIMLNSAERMGDSEGYGNVTTGDAAIIWEEMLNAWAHEQRNEAPKER